MNQEEKRLYLIKYLLDENNKSNDVKIPSDELEQKKLLRVFLMYDIQHLLVLIF